MSVELYERYMEALRGGHVALSRGQFDAALVAYREAADLATDRASPHAGIGNVHLQQGMPAEALMAYEAALARRPHDEAALDGKARALASTGRRTEAADILDILSEVQEAEGRLADASDTVRRALELAEQKARRRHAQALTRHLRLSLPDLEAEEALSKALLPLDAEEAAALKTRSARTSEAASAAEAEVALPAVPPPPPPPAVPAREPEPLELMAQAEAAVDAGKREAAGAAYLRAATGFHARGLYAAALDACYLGLWSAPADPHLHLRLVELYLALEWDGLAADKLALLGRLSDLDGHDHRTRARIVSLAADHFPDDPRLRSLSA
jgi:tetratricopeptide (TPR) repeat protein